MTRRARRSGAVRRLFAAVLAGCVASGTAACAQTPEYIRVDLPSSVAPSPAGVSSVGPSSARPGSPAVDLVVIGDSTTAGTVFGGQGRYNWVSLVGDRIAEDQMPVDVIKSSHGGSGYLNRGPDDTVFAEEAEAVVSESAAVVVVFGSGNDVDEKGDVGAAATQICRRVARVAPRARLLYVAPSWTRGQAVPRELRSIAEAIGGAAKECAGAQFLDPIGERWFPDLTGMIGGDGIHPTNAGHEVFATHIYPVVKRLLADATRPG